MLALTSDISYLDLSRHASLVIGAWEGAEGGVHYGTANAELAPSNGQWVLGGGGGTLYVDFRLAGDYDLVLGNGQSRGTVVLTNPDNSFTGTITLSEGMTLLCSEDAALGNATLSLGYTRRASLSGLEHAAADSAGIWLVDGISSNATLDLRGYASLALGSGGGDVRFSGNILVGEGTDTEAGQAYRFSSAEGTLTVETSLGGAHDVMVDAQGYSGGTVVLANVSNLTGSITVRGHDAAYSGLTGGDIILRFAQDNVLGGISGLRLEEGSTLDIGTGTQTIKASLISGNGTISSQAGGTLRLDADTETELDIGLDVDKLVVTGDAPLYLSSSAGYGTLLVEGGLLVLAEGYKFLRCGRDGLYCRHRH